MVGIYGLDLLAAVLCCVQARISVVATNASTAKAEVVGEAATTLAVMVDVKAFVVVIMVQVVVATRKTTDRYVVDERQ